MLLLGLVLLGCFLVPWMVDCVEWFPGFAGIGFCVCVGFLVGYLVLVVCPSGRVAILLLFVL